MESAQVTQTTETRYSNGGGLSKWLRDNAWNLIVTGWMVGAGILFLQFRVASIEKAQAQIEKNLGDYPSVDYFNEKFKNLQEADSRQENQLKDANDKLQKHLDDYQNFVKEELRR